MCVKTNVLARLTMKQNHPTTAIRSCILVLGPVNGHQTQLPLHIAGARWYEMPHTADTVTRYCSSVLDFSGAGGKMSTVSARDA